ncbi:CopG family transcriptional regulator [Oligella ureolytica]|nr:CopG family transcriptional regulator [Alcaligenaceae bacterium]
MKKWLVMAALAIAPYAAQATAHTITVFQDPNCGCCSGWVDHMREAGFEVNAVNSNSMAMVKHKLGVPMELASCHTAILEETGQIIEGHVPANVVHKLLADNSVGGVAAPGMPLNAPGMGELDGNLITVDFDGQFFSRD